MAATAKDLKQDLRRLGLGDKALAAAWPGWWSDDAENSASARAELRFSLARKLGLDPRSLLGDEQPRFIWQGARAKFKRLSTESELELSAIGAYGTSIAKGLITSSPAGISIEGTSAAELRQSILSSQPHVHLVNLLGLCWGIGLPVIHLRVFPLSAKRMCAMTARVGDRYVILLGKDANYPAPIAYYLAHEIGHIALQHVATGDAIVDLEDPLKARDAGDDEEDAADRYALELLTGAPSFTIGTATRRYTAAQLAGSIKASAADLRVEPGTLALCFGHTTGQWSKANAAMKTIYLEQQPVWNVVNGVATRQMDWTQIPEDFSYFLRAVMGGLPASEGSGR